MIRGYKQRAPSLAKDGGGVSEKQGFLEEMIFQWSLKVWVGVYAENEIWGSCSRPRTAWLKARGCEKSWSVVGTVSHLVLLKKVSVGLCVAGNLTGELVEDSGAIVRFWDFVRR